MALKDWKRNVVEESGGYSRYEFVMGDFTIDVDVGGEQGFPASNQVNVFGGRQWGGWLLGTPKNFRSKKEVDAFVSFAMKELEAGRLGKKVAFPL